MSQETVYLAAPFAWASKMQKVAAELRDAGYDVVSRWHDPSHNHGKSFIDGDRAGMYAEASDDLDDLDRAGILIAFTQPPHTKFSSGGRHVEFGYALASGHVTYVVGPTENVFHNMANEVFETWELAKAVLVIQAAPQSPLTTE